MNESQKCAWEREREREANESQRWGSGRETNELKFRRVEGGEANERQKWRERGKRTWGGERTKGRSEGREANERQNWGGERMKARNDERIEIRPLKERSSKSKKVNCQSIRNNPK